MGLWKRRHGGWGARGSRAVGVWVHSFRAVNRVQEIHCNVGGRCCFRQGGGLGGGGWGVM